MCGLCGFFTQSNTNLSPELNQVRGQALAGLMMLNQSRGSHATGMALVKPGRTPVLLKDSVPAIEFVDRPNIITALQGKRNQAILGHTRLGTMGTNIAANAHPFTEGKITGTHNGIINNYWDIDDTVTVDSQAIFRLLDQKEPENVFPKINGSCTCVWVNSEDPKALYMVAHYNPLHVAFVPGLSTYFYSSEDSHLAAIMRSMFGKNYELFVVPEDTIYRFDLDTLEATTTETSFKPYTGYAGSSYHYPQDDHISGKLSDEDLALFWQGRAQAEPTVDFLDDCCAYCGKDITSKYAYTDETYTLFVCPKCLYDNQLEEEIWNKIEFPSKQGGAEVIVYGS